MDEWSVPNPFRLGDRVSWRGVTLVCTRGHYAGDAAEHPWDPGDGWSVATAATLWTPSGRVEVSKLANRAAFEAEDRLREVMLVAAGAMRLA